MDKKALKREDLKTNFLRQAVIRIDYDMLFDKDIEKYLEKIYTHLIKEKYKMNSNTTSSFKVNITMDQDTDVQNNVSNILEEYTAFINEDETIEIDITKRAIAMVINYKQFVCFEKIIELYSYLIENLINIREGFSFYRVGIKKTNVIYMKSINNISNYLEEISFANKSKIGGLSTNLLIKDVSETFEIDKYKVNRETSVANVVYVGDGKKPRKAYQVQFDIDLYDEIVKDNNIDLKHMNDILFEVYKDTLKEEFLLKLQNENYKDKEIIIL